MNIDSQFVIQKNPGEGKFTPMIGGLRVSSGKLLTFLPKDASSEIGELSDEQLLSLDENLKIYSGKLNSAEADSPGTDYRKIRQRAYKYIIQIKPMEREKLYALLEFLHLDECRKTASIESCKNAIAAIRLKIQQVLQERNSPRIAIEKYPPKSETSHKNPKLIQRKGAQIISMIPDDIKNELSKLNLPRLLSLQIKFEILASQISEFRDDEMENVETFQRLLETILNILHLKDIPALVSFLRGNTMPTIVRAKIRQVNLYLRKIMKGEAKQNLVS